MMVRDFSAYSMHFLAMEDEIVLLSFLLSVLVWILGGMIVSTLVNVAQWGLATRRPDVKRAGVRMVGLGALAAVVGGGLGRWLLGTPFGLPSALWTSGIVMFFVAWIAGRKQVPMIHG